MTFLTNNFNKGRKEKKMKRWKKKKKPEGFNSYALTLMQLKSFLSELFQFNVRIQFNPEYIINNLV